MALLLIAPAANAALPEFATDVRPFLRAAEARHPAARPAARNPQETARAYYATLRRGGHIRAQVDVILVDNAGDSSPGAADYDFPGGRCSLLINERLLKGSVFDDALMFRFMVYHELAHCQLFADPHEISPFPGLSRRARAMVSDLLYLDFLHQEEPADESPHAPQVSGYYLYHETYADLKALAILLSEGFPPETVDRVLSLRAERSIMADDPHGTDGALTALKTVSWASLGPEELDAKARALADAAIAPSFLRQHIGTHAYASKPSDIISRKVRAALSQLNHPESSSAVRTQARILLASSEASSVPAWREYARLARRGELGATGSDAPFFRARYDAALGELSAEDEAVRAALKALP